MIAKIFPILLALIGLGAGVGGGIALRPPPQDMAMENPCGDVSHDTEDDHEMPEEDAVDEENGNYDYVKLNNQFVVPVVQDGRVQSLVVMSISLEVTPGQSETIYQIEPKLRDLFLQVLFDHAKTGGFSGQFTKSTRMNTLRTSLREAAQKVLGNAVSKVLIGDVVRQDA